MYACHRQITHHKSYIIENADWLKGIDFVDRAFYKDSCPQIKITAYNVVHVKLHVVITIALYILWFVDYNKNKAITYHCLNSSKILPKYLRNRDKIDIASIVNTYVHERAFTWLGIDTSIKSVGISLVVWAQTTVYFFLSYLGCTERK